MRLQSVTCRKIKMAGGGEFVPESNSILAALLERREFSPDLVDGLGLVAIGYDAMSDQGLIEFGRYDRETYRVSVQSLPGNMAAVVEDFVKYATTKLGGRLTLRKRGGHVWMERDGSPADGAFVFTESDLGLWLPPGRVHRFDGLTIGVNGEELELVAPRDPETRMVKLRVERMPHFVAVTWFQGLATGTLANCGSTLLLEGEARGLISVLSRRIAAGCLEVESVARARGLTLTGFEEQL